MDNDIVKKTVYDKLFIKVVLLIASTNICGSDKQGLGKKWDVVWSKRLTTTQKLERLKTQYLVLQD